MIAFVSLWEDVRISEKDDVVELLKKGECLDIGGLAQYAVPS